MKSLFVRGIPDDAHADLKAVAGLSGLSLRAVVAAILARDFGRTPSPHWPAVNQALTAVRRINREGVSQ